MSEAVFRPLADFAEKVELAVGFRTAELSASVRALSMQPWRSGGAESLTRPVVLVRRQRSIEQVQEASPVALRRLVASGAAWEREPVVDTRIDLAS